MQNKTHLTLFATALILWGCGESANSTSNDPSNTSDITDKTSSSSSKTSSALCNENETFTDGNTSYICSDQKWIKQEISQQCTEGQIFTDGTINYICSSEQWITLEQPIQSSNSSSSTATLLNRTISSSSSCVSIETLFSSSFVKEKSSSSIITTSSSSDKAISSSSVSNGCNEGEQRIIYVDSEHTTDICQNGSWKYPSSSCEKGISESKTINGISYTSSCINDTLYFDFAYKYLYDTRDARTYKVIKIGTQIWMAENLKIEVKNSFCYDDNNVNCDAYGRLYTWAAAMDSAGEYSIISKGCGQGKTCSPTSTKVQGICPYGYHLPSQSEWNTLIQFAGGNKAAASALKSKENWDYVFDLSLNKTVTTNGTDIYGFKVLPGGHYHITPGSEFGLYLCKGTNAGFWTSTEEPKSHISCDKEFITPETEGICYGNPEWMAYSIYFFDNEEIDTRTNQDNKTKAFSIRCIKD